MLKFMSFSSGSCGNCYYVGTEDAALLIDAGISLRRLKKAFADNGLDMDKVVAILVTHDHLDHIRHLGSFCKKLYKPVYTTETIHNALSRHPFTASSISSCRNVLHEGEQADISGIGVSCFVVPHDATQTVGYSLAFGEKRFVIMTDLGRMTDEAVEYASDADIVVMESNYDVDMLVSGPYTHELKMRIMQGNGHLSNDECAAAVARICRSGRVKDIFLCHLSENNNTPRLAFDASSAAIRDSGPDRSVTLRCLPRTCPSGLFVL